MEGMDLNDKWPWKQMMGLYLVGTFVILLILCVFLACSAFAYTNGNSYPDRPDQSLRAKYAKTYHRSMPVVVDRYDVRKLQNDPEVLVSAPPVPEKVRVVEKVVYVERKPVVATISAEWGN